MKLLVSLLFSICSAALGQVVAQPTLSLSADQVSYRPGQTAIITVTLSKSAGTNLSAVAFDISGTGVTFNAQNTQLTGPQPGKAIVSYNRTLQELYATVVGDLGDGLNNLPLADGPIVAIPVLIGVQLPPGVLTINLSQTDGASVDSSGNVTDVPTLGAGVTFTISASPCDVNRDGKVDALDVSAAALALAQNQPGGIAWSLTLVNVVRVLQAAMGGPCTL